MMTQRDDESTGAGTGGSMAGVLYSGLCYVAMFAGILYLILFVADLGFIAGISRGAEYPVAVAVAIDVGLILLWGLQHSVMARRRFKDVWSRLVPAHTERATYCLASGATLIAVCYLWAPIGGQIWHLEGAAAAALRALSAAGWLFMLTATFEIDHFELFGLKQPLRALRRLEMPRPQFQRRFLYGVVRHPIQLGVLVGIWATPNMTGGHLLFGALMTVYIFVGLHFEERALVREFGRRYEDYRSEVPKVLPFPRPGRAVRAPATSG